MMEETSSQGDLLAEFCNPQNHQLSLLVVFLAKPMGDQDMLPLLINLLLASCKPNINVIITLKRFILHCAKQGFQHVRKVNRIIYPDAVTRDRMRLIGPKSGQLEPIHHCCLVEEL